MVYNYECFYTPDLSLLTDDCLDALYELYDGFMNEYRESIAYPLHFNYFLSFAKFCDPARYYYNRRSMSGDLFKYKQFPEYEIDHELIQRMYEYIKHHSYNQFFTILTSDSFMYFIAPFLQEHNEYEEYDFSDEEDSQADRNIIIMPNEYEIHDE